MVLEGSRPAHWHILGRHHYEAARTGEEHRVMVLEGSSSANEDMPGRHYHKAARAGKDHMVMVLLIRMQNLGSTPWA